MNSSRIVYGTVAFHANKILFSAHENDDFIIESSADFNVIGKSYVEFSPGFEAKLGSKMNVQLDNTKTSSLVLQRKQITSKHAFNYTKKSPYKGQMYDYSVDEEEPILAEQELQATIYPNPFENYFSIELETDSQISSTEIVLLEIYDMVGNKILEKEMKKEDLQFIDVSELSSGIYFINLKIENYQTIQKKLANL